MVKRQFGTIASAFKRVSLSTWLSLVLGTAILVVLIEWLDSWSLRVVQDWTHLQQNPTDTTQKQFNASLEIVKAIVGGIGTLATIVGGIVLYLNFRVANKNAETAIDTVKVANRNAELTESRLITERFSKAVEQLGSDKIEVRLGGIYSLERIAQDSVRDYWTIMEVLTAFVREKSPVEIAKPKAKKSFAEQYLQQSEMEKLSFSQVTKDVQAALTVIGRRDTKQDQGKSLDLSSSDLGFANLRGAKLQGAILDNAVLSSADLRDAVLHDATLIRANLHCAVLILADLKGANLGGTKLIFANLSSADLRDAILVSADLRGADFSSAKLQGANFSSAVLILADLRGAKLQGANFTNAVGLTEEQLETAKLCKTTMPDGTTSDRDCEAMNIPLSTSSANETEPGSH